jgi:hypothetical protein
VSVGVSQDQGSFRNPDFSIRRHPDEELGPDHLALLAKPEFLPPPE